MYLSVQKLRPHAQLPKRATAQSAGYDLYALPESPLTIQPGEICKVPTGIAVAPSRPDVALCIFPRSGLSTKHGITLINSVGLVDSDYRGEVKVILINLGSEDFVISDGDRIAQMVVAPVTQGVFENAEFLDETERGSGGFGHTGK